MTEGKSSETKSTAADMVRLAAARLSQSPSAALDARVLVGAALGLAPAALVSEGVRALRAEERARIEEMVARRERGEPVAYIVGEKEFWSLAFEMSPGVLIPRPDSETLVEAACKRRRPAEVKSILDLGCGSGALLAALLTEFPQARGLGVDANPAAVALASRNLQRLGLGTRGAARKGDWGRGMDETFDLIVSNPPYIRDADRDGLPREVRDHEDPGALFGGPDGLDAYRAIFSHCFRILDPGGLMVLEMASDQARDLAAMAAAAVPHAVIEVANDLAGRPRALVLDLRGENNR